jgi:cytochrome c553
VSGLTRRIGLTATVLVGAAVVAAAAVYGAAERRIARRYAVPPTAPLPAAGDSAVARGRHLATIMTCVLCHGTDLGGSVYDDRNPMAVIAGPNLTRGGRGATLADADWVRALRYGVHRDGTSLVVMPSEVFVHASDADVAAIVAYARSLPPVRRDVPATGYRPLGRALLAAGKLNLLVASKTPRVAWPASVRPEPTAAYGRYLADVTGCHGCHGYGLSGGRVAGPPGLPPASNLTPDPATGIARWQEADLVRALRTGRRPDGRAIDDFMPWRMFAAMTDDEIHALWLYLRGVPPRPFGHK